MTIQTQLLIGSAFEAGAEAKEPVLNPRTGRLILDIPEASTGQVDRAVAAARKAFEGWSRTGESFNVAPAASSGLAPVCRFFGVGFAPLSSHFYTPYPDECDVVKTDPKWLYEKTAFGLALPDAATHGCPLGTRPLYRLWNHNLDGAPNHRYTTSTLTFDEMIGQGWVFEGEKETRVFACVPN